MVNFRENLSQSCFQAQEIWGDFVYPGAESGRIG